MNCKVTEYSISELTTFINRGIPPKYIEEEGLIVINQKCIRDWKVNLELTRFNDIKKRKVDKSKIVQKFDILVNSTGMGTLGRVAQYYENMEVTVDSHVTIVRPDPDKVDPLYFGYVLKMNQKNIESLAEGSTGQTELKRVSLGNLKVRIIDNLEKQREVASILFNLDNKIWTNEKINPLLETISQSLFNSWFVDFDPVRAKIEAIAKGKDAQLAAMQAISGKTEEDLKKLSDVNYQKLSATADLFPNEIEDTEHGEIPLGWEWISLYDSAKFVNGSAFNAKNFSKDNKGLPIVKIAELKSGISPQTKFTINDDIKEKYAINNGSLLYSWSGSPDTSLETFKWFGGKGWLNQHIFLINTQFHAQKVFIYYLLKYLKPELIQIAKNKQTTGLGHVTVADMKRIKIAFPNKNGFRIIEEYLNPNYDMDSNNTLQNRSLVQLRDSLIPRLMNNQVQL
jgi:type I restriction enzyme S subunit